MASVYEVLANQPYIPRDAGGYPADSKCWQLREAVLAHYRAGQRVYLEEGQIFVGGPKEKIRQGLLAFNNKTGGASIFFG